MLSSSPRDNWERLVAAVIKRDQIRWLCHQDSIPTATTSSCSHTSSDSSEEFRVSSNQLKRISVRPPRHRPFSAATGIEVRKNASGTITRKLFSALQRRMKPKENQLGYILEGRARRYSLLELQSATDKFHSRNILRRGSHGNLYKGRLADGSLVAVKRLTAELQEIGTELDVTSIVAHRNVLCASGFCFREKERLLVFPFMANGSVASLLRERHESLPPLNWAVRKQIALGAAKGLAYLHNECLREIIHCDVKAENILLDEDFEAVVADFDLAEFMDCYDGRVVAGMKGTPGHMATEYLATGEYSVKADVFGYGVFLLELITAQKSYDRDRGDNDDEDVMLLDMVKRTYKERTWKRLIDPNLPGDFPVDDVEKLLRMALVCTQTDPGRRPTMLEVVRMLEVGYGLAERWQELYEIEFEAESIEFEAENVELGNLRRLTMQELRAATDDFRDKIIGEDGFNMLYKGCLNGSPVVVKRYNSPSLQYYFQKDLDIARISSHPNIVHAIGFCHTPEEQLLVFRWMPNGSVTSWLTGRHESRPPLTWQKRKTIALGVARGLAYLHDKCEMKIIHRDVKAANILLDENFEAVIADFKSAEVLNLNETRITTTVTGTIGHIAPEYLATGECSDKIDVFGYGAFLLELITGKKIMDLVHVANDEDMWCPDWVKRNYERGWKLMFDKEAGGDISEPVLENLVQIAVLCTQYDPKKRPKMSEVVRMLNVYGGSAESSLKQLGEFPKTKVDEGKWQSRYKKLDSDVYMPSTVDEEYHFGLKIFSRQELRVATDDFRDKIIHEDSGETYKGRLADGFLVAVKRLNDRFITSEELFSSIVSHRYVSDLLGFCIMKKEKLLVFSYMANRSVASCLRERRESQPPLDWEIRSRIAIKVARGLVYLHHDCLRPIIHLDIKAENILLDENFEPVVSDFSFAKFMDDDSDVGVRGTIGHIAPEYLSTGKCTLKSDVYSYGAFLLELITGQRVSGLARLANDDYMMLLDWVKKVYSEKNFKMIVDRDLEGKFIEEEVEKLLRIALTCMRSDPERRPMMSEVVRMLEYGDGDCSDVNIFDVGDDETLAQDDEDVL